MINNGYNAGQEYYDEPNYSDNTEWYIPDSTSFIVTIIIMAICTFVLLKIHNKANKQLSASKYFGGNGYRVKDRREQYLRSYDTVQRGYYNSGSSSSRGGSSSHRSSSGVRHGGGGRRF